MESYLQKPRKLSSKFFLQFQVNSPDGWPELPGDLQSVLLNEHRILQEKKKNVGITTFIPTQ